mmetsp:Transcript_31206/g.72767  ORF Transcript_31206/g.72767 Transcript_31206/m.72767 type:complete len:205 (-) Transcript_31206:16-630(-)
MKTRPSPWYGPSMFCAPAPASTCRIHSNRKLEGSQNSQFSDATKGQPATGRPNTSSLLIVGGFTKMGRDSPPISSRDPCFSASATGVLPGTCAPFASTKPTSMPVAVTSAPGAFFRSFFARFLSPPAALECLPQLMPKRTRNRSTGSSRPRSRFNVASRQLTSTLTSASPATERTTASAMGLAPTCLSRLLLLLQSTSLCTCLP